MRYLTVFANFERKVKMGDKMKFDTYNMFGAYLLSAAMSRLIEMLGVERWMYRRARRKLIFRKRSNGGHHWRSRTYEKHLWRDVNTFEMWNYTTFEQIVNVFNERRMAADRPRSWVFALIWNCSWEEQCISDDGGHLMHCFSAAAEPLLSRNVVFG